MTQSQNLLDLIAQLNNNNIKDVTAMLCLLKGLCGREVKYRWVSDDRIFDDGLKTKGLIVLCTDTKFKFERELQDQCNGVVISFDFNSKVKFNAVAVPPGAFDDNFRLGKLLRDKTAKIYKAIDGTTCTLFNYNNKWIIGTARGCNMNNQIWNGDITFEQALLECTSSYNFSYDLLDKSLIYTIGFSHPKMHPLAKKPSSWLISVSRVGYEHNAEADNLMLLPGNDLLPPQLPIDIDFNTMTSNCNNSIKDYLANNEPIYGYVIRTSTGSYLVRSKLMMFIKRYYHTIPSDIPVDRKTNYANIRGYLSIDKAKYASIFKTEELFSKYDNIIADLANKIVSYGRLKTSAKYSMNKDSSDVIVAKMFNIIDAKSINLSTSEGYSVIIDLLTNKNNIDLYFDNKLL